MKLLSILFYHLGNIVSITLSHWRWGGWLYQKMMLLSVDCDKNFDIWQEVKKK